MKPKNRNTLFLLFITAILSFILILIFLQSRNLYSANPLQTPIGSDEVNIATATSVWKALMRSTPHAYTSPLPAAAQSPLDGIYSMIDQSLPQWWKCVRCADYRPVGGIWKLQFDKGIMRIFYEVTSWRSIASFTVSDDRLFIFNDPYCPETIGEYKWRVEGGQLKLESVDDACAFDLRAKNLSRQSWSYCANSSQVVDSNSSKQEPPGCEDNLVMPTPVVQSDLPITVVVYGGDSRFFEKPPDVAAKANTADTQPPDGIDISFDGNTIPYGVHRVLWWNGNWIEASTDLPFTAMGVQFFGEQQIGWARILFDGVEVWRGNTSAIWSRNARHGGYIEISGFALGKHTIRAESLDFDYRPVTVASFGFSYENGVGIGAP